MATYTGARNLEDLSDITAAAKTLTTSAASQFGDGATATTITHATARAILKGHQWTIYENDDGSPVLVVGTHAAPTVIIDSYHGTPWATGGNFREGTADERPVLRFLNCNYVNTGAGRQSKFGGNLMRLRVEAERCNFGFSDATSVPFFGVDGVFRSCSISCTSSTDARNALFIGLPRVFENILIRTWFMGLKIEYGVSFYGSIRFEDCRYEAFCLGQLSADGADSGRAGYMDGALNLVDSVFDKTRVRTNLNGTINAWRRVRVSTRQADGAAVSGVKLYALSGSAERNFSITCNVSVAAVDGVNRYRGEDTTINSRTKQRDLMYYFRPGDRVRISGFDTAANNGVFAVTGRQVGSAFFADARILYADNTAAVAEAAKSVTIERLPPVSDASGTMADYPILVDHAVHDNTRNVNPDSDATVQSGTTTLAEMLAGTRARAGYFERTNWRLVVVPPYPHRRQQIDAVLNPDDSDKPFEWSPLMAEHDALELTAAECAALTAYDDWDAVHDYLEYYKRQDGNESFPRVDLGIAALDGTTLDFGDLDVTIDGAPGAAPVSRPVGGGITIRQPDGTGPTDRIRGIRTAGAFAFVNGASADVSVTDRNGSSFIVSVNRRDARVYAAIRNADGTYGTPVNSPVDPVTGEATFTVTAGATVELTVKAPGHLTARRAVDTSVTLTPEVNLAADSAVDLGAANDVSDVTADMLSLSYEHPGRAIITAGTNLSNRLPKTIRAIDALLSTEQGIEFLARVPRALPAASAGRRVPDADITLPSEATSASCITFLRNKMYVCDAGTLKIYKCGMDGTKEAEAALPAGFAPVSLSAQNGEVWVGLRGDDNFTMKMVPYSESLAEGAHWNLSESYVPDGAAWIDHRPYLLDRGDGSIRRWGAAGFRTGDDDSGYTPSVAASTYRDMAYDGRLLLLTDTGVVRVSDDSGTVADDVVPSLDAANADPHAMAAYAGYIHVLDREDGKTYAYLDRLPAAFDGGEPYRFTSKTLSLSEQTMEFAKSAAYTLQQVSQLGVAAYGAGGAVYEAPFYANGRVLFDTLSEIIVLTSDEAENAAEAVGSSPAFMSALGAAVWGTDPRDFAAESREHTYGHLTDATLSRMTLERMQRLDADVSSRLAASAYAAPPAAPDVSGIATLLERLTAARAAHLDADISSRLAASAYTAAGSAPTAAETATAVWNAIEIAAGSGKFPANGTVGRDIVDSLATLVLKSNKIRTTGSAGSEKVIVDTAGTDAKVDAAAADAKLARKVLTNDYVITQKTDTAAAKLSVRDDPDPDNPSATPAVIHELELGEDSDGNDTGRTVGDTDAR